MSDALSLSEAAVREGRPHEALAQLTAAVRAKPADAALRIYLAQLLCVLGQWERAHTQLNVVADMDETTGPMREMVGHALRCELLRKGVFDGRRSPMIFGQPDEWLALLIESQLRAGAGELALSQQLATRAFDAAPASSGKIDGQPFSWIADADSRLGPVLEAMINGRYYWVPFSRLARVAFEAPVDLRDVVWSPAKLQFSNGGEAIAMVPTRYAGSELSDDAQILMARKTEWQAAPAAPDAGQTERWIGLGQRVFITDLGEHDLLSVRLIELDGDDAAAAEPHG